MKEKIETFPIGKPVDEAPVRSITDLASVIASRRSELRLTQVDLAAAAGTGNRFIVELEQGKATVRADKVLAVLRELGLELLVRPVRRSTHVHR
jgi:HTH-type transcriptional regulator/antitoxin HipB